MTTIYLIRHAEAEGNLYRRIHGHYDSLVTVRGRKQIGQLEKRFENIRVDRVYASDLYRARATAKAVAESRGLTIETTPSLREVAMGVWEDKTWGEVERFEPEQLLFFNNDPTRWHIEGGEAFDSLQKRISDAVYAIAARHDGETVAIVSHGSAIRAFMCEIYGVPPRDIQRVKHYDNTAVTLLRVDGGKTDVEFAGDNSHLPEELSTFAHQKWWRENAALDTSNLRFTPADFKNDTETYLKFRRDTWTELYGTAENVGGKWLESARRHAASFPRAVSLALVGDKQAGLVELDTTTGADEKTGVVEFFYMTPEQRRTGIAVQLLGQAVSVYRSLGRERVRMSVSVRNGQTLAFCAKYGFEKTGETFLHGDRHDVLELDIALR